MMKRVKIFQCFSLFLNLAVVIFSVAGCAYDRFEDKTTSADVSQERVLLSEIPDSAAPFCENSIPLSGGCRMIMCKDSEDSLCYSAFVKDADGMYTKVNFAIPDTLIFDSAELLGMPSGGGGSGEYTLYLKLTKDGPEKYVFFTTNFSSDCWWNYECCGESSLSAEEIRESVFENESIKTQTDYNS